MIDHTKNISPLDLSYLSDMSGDSADFMIEMIDMFKFQTPTYIADLERAIEEKDWEKASGCAHKIKPTLSYLGREDARVHLQHMENCTRELKDLEEMPKALKDFKEFAEILYRQLDKSKMELLKRL